MDPVLDTDVVIVGAGPVGLTLANLLGDYGIRVLVVEKNAGVNDEPRAISITDETLRTMQQIGVLDRLRPEMLTDTGARYYGRRGQVLAQTRPAQAHYGHPGKSQFDQPILESLLLDAARSRDGVQLRFDTESTAVVERGDHVETATTGPDGASTVRSGWVVACDGGRSTVRTRLGITMQGSTQTEKWIVTDLLNTSAREKYAEFHCNGVRPCVIVPGVKGRCRFEFMLLPGESAEDMTTTTSILSLVEPYLDRPVHPDDIRRSAVYVAHQRVAQHYRQGRVLLAGDSAHMMPPFAGQGLNAGIRDSANLAWKLASLVKGTGTDRLISTYETERRPHAVDMVKVSHRIGRVVMSTNPIVTFVRDALVTATALVPAAQAYVASMKFLKRPHFDDGCLVPPDNHLPKALAELVGAALWQPQVRSEDGAVRPLDEVMGDRWCALTFQTGPGTTIEVTDLEEHAPTVTVEDEANTFGTVFRGRYTLIVRPDRYVAAVARAGDEDKVLSSLRRYVPTLRSCDTRPVTHR